MTIFYLIRHAHCAAIGHTIAGLEEGIHLSPQGRLQAMRLAKQLSLKPIGTVCCSPLERAYETAEPIADLLGLRIEISQAWEEIHYGDWTGRAIHELKMDPDWLRFNEFRSGTRIPSGELIIEVQARMVMHWLTSQGFPSTFSTDSRSPLPRSVRFGSTMTVFKSCRLIIPVILRSYNF